MREKINERAWRVWMEHVGPMRVTVAVLLPLSLTSACSAIMIGEPVPMQDISIQDDAEENLKAIRAMLADQAPRQTEEKPPDASLQPSSSESTPSLIEPLPSTRPAAAASSLAGRADAPAKLPWTPTAPDRPAVADRSVPAYTTPAPVAPDYPGSIRCVPDGMGGQRCLGR